jgi:hypothetical protein
MVGRYFYALHPDSTRGERDHPVLSRSGEKRCRANGRPQTVIRNPEGRFQLFRIGDAVAARNTHAAIYDASRLAKDI